LRRAAYAGDSPAFLGEPVTPFCPNLISFVVLPCLAKTACDLVGWLGVALGLLYPLNVSDPRLMFGITFSFVRLPCCQQGLGMVALPFWHGL